MLNIIVKEYGEIKRIITGARNVRYTPDCLYWEEVHPGTGEIIDMSLSVTYFMALEFYDCI